MSELFGGARFIGTHVPLEPIGTFVGRIEDERLEQELGGNTPAGVDLSRKAFKYLHTMNHIDYIQLTMNVPPWPHFRGTRVYVGESIYDRATKGSENAYGRKS